MKKRSPTSPAMRGKAAAATSAAYPVPPFPKQQQPWPGLACRMDPVPDNGERRQFCRQLVADTMLELGGLDILVNNAARQISRPTIEDIRDEDFDETFKTNVYAMFWITKAAVPYLKTGSAIINTSSVVAYDASDHLLDYAATKAAIAIFTKGLAKQLADRGILVNAVAPGPVWTPLQVAGGQPPEKVPTFGQDTPVGRPGRTVAGRG